MIWNSYPKPYVVFIAKPSTYAACYLIELCQIVVTLSEIHFILSWSRSRTRFHHMLCFYTRSKQNSIRTQNKTPCPCMTPLSQKYVKDMGLCKKENKRCIPKEGMPHASACQKKRKEKIAPYPKTKKKRDGAYKGVHTPSTKKIHTLPHLDQGLWLVSPLDPVFDLAKMWEAGMPSILHTYSSTKIAIRDGLRK